MRELSVMRRRGLGMSGHFGVISAETVIQATAAVMQITIIWSMSKPVLGISLFLHTHAIHIDENIYPLLLLVVVLEEVKVEEPWLGYAPWLL